MIALLPARLLYHLRDWSSRVWRLRVHCIIVRYFPVVTDSDYFHIRCRAIVSGHEMCFPPMRAVWRAAPTTCRRCRLEALFALNFRDRREEVARQRQQPRWRFFVFRLVVTVDDEDGEEDADTAYEEDHGIVDTCGGSNTIEVIEMIRQDFRMVLLPLRVRLRIGFK